MCREWDLSLLSAFSAVIDTIVFTSGSCISDGAIVFSSTGDGEFKVLSCSRQGDPASYNSGGGITGEAGASS
jgi:ubiquitin C-terminal hydrolase